MPKRSIYLHYGHNIVYDKSCSISKTSMNLLISFILYNYKIIYYKRLKLLNYFTTHVDNILVINSYLLFIIYYLIW